MKLIIADLEGTLISKQQMSDSTKQTIQKLKDQGYVFSNGYGKLKDKTFRIAHMADTTIEELKAYLETIDKLI